MRFHFVQCHRNETYYSSVKLLKNMSSYVCFHGLKLQYFSTLLYAKRKACYLASYYKPSISMVSDEIQAATREKSQQHPAQCTSTTNCHDNLPRKKPKLLRQSIIFAHNFFRFSSNMQIHVRRATNNHQHSIYFSLCFHMNTKNLKHTADTSQSFPNKKEDQMTAV